MAHELTGRFLKAKKNEPVGIPIKMGEFVEIQANGKGKTTTGSNWDCIPVQSEYFELMPEGFMPSSRFPEIGEYFVTLKVSESSSSACAKNNFIFKQREVGGYSKPVTDTRGSSGNGNRHISFDLKKDLKAWRFATKEEIAEYDRLGVPYDVTTLKTESLLEKAARLYPIGTTYTPLDTAGEPYNADYQSARAPKALANGIDVGYGYVYHYVTDKWAAIVTSTTSTEPIPSIIHEGFKVGDRVLCIDGNREAIVVGFDPNDDTILVDIGPFENDKEEEYGNLYDEKGVALGATYAVDGHWHAPSSLKKFEDAKPKVVETNLEKARRLYPKGTKFRSVGSDKIYTSVSPHNEYETGNIDCGSGYVYKKDVDKWAEIVTEEASEPIPEVPKRTIHHGGFHVGDVVSCTGMTGVIVGFDTSLSGNACVEAGKDREARETNEGLYNEHGEKLPLIMTIDRRWRTASSLTLLSSSSRSEVSDTLKDLPAKWSVQVTSESIDALGRWRDAGTISTIDGFCLSYHNGAQGWYSDSFHQDFPLITFEQFQEHVLGKPKVLSTERPSSEGTVKKFPENWFIRGSVEFSRLVGPFANINGDSSSKCYWLKSSKFVRDSGDWGCANRAPLGYIEITLSDLQAYLESPNTIAEYIECINSGKSYPSHSGAEGFGCTRYARRSLTEGRIYKVIRKILIGSTPGYSCTDGEWDYLISEDGTRKSTFSAYETQRKLDQITKPMTPAEKLGYKIGELFKVISGENFSTGEIIRFEKDDGSICPKFSSVTTGKNAYKDLNSIEPYVQEYWYFDDTSITESQFNYILGHLTSRGYTFKEHCTFKLSFSSFKAEGCLRSSDKFPLTFCIDNNSQNANVRKTRSDFGLTSSVSELGPWIPEIGEHAIMINAGGYGYHPDNNGCVALIQKVGTRTLSLSRRGPTVPSIDGTIINPKRSSDSKTFRNIPIYLNDGEIICRKATPQEVEAAMDTFARTILKIGNWYKYREWYFRFHRISSDGVVQSSEHYNADGSHVTIEVGWGVCDSLFQSHIIPMTLAEMTQVIERFNPFPMIHPTYKDLVPGVWYSSKNSYSSKSDCFKFHHMTGETIVFYSECVIHDKWTKGMGDWAMVKDLYVTPKEHLCSVLPSGHPDISGVSRSSENSLSTLELLPMRVKI